MKEDFCSSNEMFGTLISGIGLDAYSNSIKLMMHYDIAPNDTEKKESMTIYSIKISISYASCKI
jgi:hypothetical protein